ncbi:hypothetical protein [Actinoplanes rectilineatus]|uniref:hypothetical protein n=1 Tax=Actinoplanes rectilineatus TaxID=113571 RepID=UPI000AAD0918|nr:hypothetical protein [Actinoplanes rectilineatus]
MSETLLEAGAILPGTAEGAALDTMTARTYRHPALAGRTVVRLVGATVGPAEDLTMEFLGFQAGEPVTVGHARRQALGFPAWALVHDPANGRHALALVKEMEKLARVARSKPGNAKEGYDALADRLGAAAPAFLPTFWEQAGRAFLAADNQRMAGACFTAARRAEQVHGLAVDEDRLRDVHLEFAFAGALTAAMLAEYSRGVAQRRPAREAYDLVRTLAVRRVAGGLAPHVSMAADLARLAKTAGLDPEEQTDEVLARLLTYPAMARSHPSVWKAYRKALVRLGATDSGIRERLLAIIPDPPGWDVDVTDQWLELLEATGATGILTTSSGTAAHWLERFLAGRWSMGRSARKRNAGLLALIERMLPALARQDTITIAPYPGGADLDILDLCLSGGVRAGFSRGLGDGPLDVAEWAEDDRPGRRELSAIADDPVLAPMLATGVRRAILRLRDGVFLTSPALPEQTIRQAFGADGVRRALVALVTATARTAGNGTVASLHQDLIDLAPLWSPTGMALAPEAFRLLSAIDLDALLARTLRAGVLDELAWPAYESAVQQLRSITIGESWPELVVHDDRTAFVIEPDGTVTEHVFRLPPAGDPLAPARHSHAYCRYVDGDLFVGWHAPQANPGYWSSRPDEIVEGVVPANAVGWGVTPEPLPVPGGGLSTGVRPLHPGDTRGPADAYLLAGDGEAFWRCEWVSAGDGPPAWRWREFDPRTGEVGRVSVPAFFAAAGGELLPQACRLRPTPAAFAGSPLGWADGLAGWRTTIAADGSQTGDGVDGRRVVLPSAGPDRLGQHGRGGHLLAGALRLPGSQEFLPVSRVSSYRHDDLHVWTADGMFQLARRGDATSLLPPLAWLHAARARDEAGSTVLRGLDTVRAAKLLAATPSAGETVPVVATGVTLSPVTGLISTAIQPGGTDPGAAARRAAAVAAVAELLPEVGDATLRGGIATVVATAARLRARLATVTGLLSGPAGAVRATPEITDGALTKAWAGLGDVSHYYSGSADLSHRVIEQISRVGALFGPAGGPDHEALPDTDEGWPLLLTGLGAVALRAASPVTPAEDRDALAVFLDTVAGTPLAGAGTPIRLIEVTQPHQEGRTVRVHRDGDQVSVLFPPGYGSYWSSKTWRRAVLQSAPGGTFTLPPETLLETESGPGTRLSGDRVAAFTTLLRERGPAPWRPEAAEALAAATGMTRPEAALLLAGLPGIATWQATFLTAEQRAVLGLTAQQAKVGRAGLQPLTGQERIALLDAAMPTDPAALWEHGPDVAAVAEVWIRMRGRRVTVPESLVGELARVVGGAHAAEVLRVIVAPSAGDWLTTDGRSRSEGYWNLTTTADEGVPFSSEWARRLAVALPWLAYHLPWGDPVRATLPEALRLTRARLANPLLLTGSGMHRLDSRPDAGPALVDGNYTGLPDHGIHHVAPAKLSGPDDPALGFIDDEYGDALRVLLAGWIEGVLTTPEGATGEPHDPRVSVPGLVAAVDTRVGCGADAAAYYLQLLALPDPTDKAVQAWNGWKPAQLRKAREALITAGVVVTAKRERAGRPVFLPGGWVPAKAPSLPVETWKQSLYVWANGHRIVPRTLPGLFAAAWSRVESGDVPRYHELEAKP